MFPLLMWKPFVKRIIIILEKETLLCHYVTAFKLLFLCQSPGSPHLMGSPSSVRGKWDGWHFTITWGRNLIPIVPTPHLPYAKEFQGLSFLPVSFCSLFYFSFILSFSRSSLHFHPTSNLRTDYQLFLVLLWFCFKTPFVKAICVYRDFYWRAWGWSKWGWGSRWRQSKVQLITLNSGSDSRILEWASAWQVALPKPQRHSPCFQPSLQHLLLSPFSSRACHSSWWHPETHKAEQTGSLWIAVIMEAMPGCSLTLTKTTHQGI